MSSFSLNPRLCVVGWKGEVFLDRLLKHGIRPHEVVSYRQAGDRSGSFERISQLTHSANAPFFETHRPDISGETPAFLVGWQYLINSPGNATIVFHDSLLPRYRGFAPTATALMNGDRTIGVTALLPGPEVDQGPIVAQASAKIEYPMKISDALELQATLMSELALQIIQRLQRGDELAATVQDEARATYSLWRDERDYQIDWSGSAGEIKRFIDAVGYPYAGARSIIDGETVVIHEATELGDLHFERRDIGKVWQLQDGAPVIVCGKGLVRLDKVCTPEGATYQFSRLRVRVGCGARAL